jgi:hypothetical protein
MKTQEKSQLAKADQESDTAMSSPGEGVERSQAEQDMWL